MNLRTTNLLFSLSFSDRTQVLNQFYFFIFYFLLFCLMKHLQLGIDKQLNNDVMIGSVLDSSIISSFHIGWKFSTWACLYTLGKHWQPIKRIFRGFQIPIINNKYRTLFQQLYSYVLISIESPWDLITYCLVFQ